MTKKEISNKNWAKNEKKNKKTKKTIKGTKTHMH